MNKKVNRLKKYSHQLTISISFGLTTAVITSLGVIVGMHSATSSKLAVVAGVIVVAIADGLSDALGLHTSEEAEVENGNAKHTPKELWLTTLFTFISVSGFSLTFVIPILLLPLRTAVIIAIVWGILLLTLLNLYIAKIRKENPAKIIFEHILLTLLVVTISYWVGSIVNKWIS
ncbi:hypothetical protein KAW96_06290 [candidate division WOR-3 bacterium]|nr:hypothetical protein [candidate division WOR-3 bacterium]